MKHITHPHKGNRDWPTPRPTVLVISEPQAGKPWYSGRNSLFRLRAGHFPDSTPTLLVTPHRKTHHHPSLRFPPVKVTTSQMDVLISWACLEQSVPGGRHPVDRGFILSDKKYFL